MVYLTTDAGDRLTTDTGDYLVTDDADIIGSTADTTHFTADGYYPTADGYYPVYPVISAEIFEPVGGFVTADTIAITADTIAITADGGVLPGASDVADALVIAAGGAIAIETANADDRLDAEVVSVPLVGEPGGGLPPPRRRPPIVVYAAIAEVANASDVVDAEVIGAFNTLDAKVDDAAGQIVSAAIIDVSVYEPIAAVDQIAAAAIIEVSLKEPIAAVDQAEAITIEDDAGMILTFLLAA